MSIRWIGLFGPQIITPVILINSNMSFSKIRSTLKNIGYFCYSQKKEFSYPFYLL